MGARVVRPVLVAGDAGPASDAAVDWAAAEAAARGAALLIVRASPPTVTLDPLGICPGAGAGERRALDGLLLRGFRARARAVASDLEIFTYVLPGVPARVLAAESREAGLLVVGRGAPGLRRSTGDAPAIRLLSCAGCPVVVVRGYGSRAEGPVRPRVVVGVGNASMSAATLGFAFEAARQRGVPLTAVHAWQADTCADLEAVTGDVEAAESRAKSVLVRALAPCRPRFPDVPVEVRAVRGHPAQVLIEEARGAALVVVGTSGRSVLRTWAPSVGSRLVRQVSEPVAAVPSAARRRGQRRNGAARRDVTTVEMRLRPGETSWE